MTAADAHAELHDLVGRLTPDQAWRLRALAACSPELAEIVEQEDETVQRTGNHWDITATAAVSVHRDLGIWPRRPVRTGR